MSESPSPPAALLNDPMRATDNLYHPVATLQMCDRNGCRTATFPIAEYPLRPEHRESTRFASSMRESLSGQLSANSAEAETDLVPKT